MKRLKYIAICGAAMLGSSLCGDHSLAGVLSSNIAAEAASQAMAPRGGVLTKVQYSYYYGDCDYDDPDYCGYGYGYYGGPWRGWGGYGYYGGPSWGYRRWGWDRGYYGHRGWGGYGWGRRGYYGHRGWGGRGWGGRGYYGHRGWGGHGWGHGHR